MPVIKKKPQPEKTAAVSPTSTYRVPAGSSVVATTPGGGRTVATSPGPIVDLRPSSYAAMNAPQKATQAAQAAPADLMTGMSSWNPAKEAFFGAANPPAQPQSFLPPLSPLAAFTGQNQAQAQPQSEMPPAPTPIPSQQFQAAAQQQQSFLPPPSNQQRGASQAPAAMPSQPKHQTLIENAFDAVNDRFKEEMYVNFGVSIDGWQPPEGTTYSAQLQLPGGQFLAQAAVKQAALSSAKENSIKAAANLEKTGAKVLTWEGLKALAGNTPEAAGKAAFTEGIGEIPKNPKTMTLILQNIGKVAKNTWKPLAAAGAGFSLFYGKYAISESGKVAIDDDATAFSKAFVTDGQKLIEAGYPELASEIYKCAEDVKTALDSGEFDSIFGGKGAGMKRLNDCKDRLSDGLARVERDKWEKAQRDAAAAQAKAVMDAAAAKEAADTKLDEQRDYQEQQTRETRAWQQFQTEDTRAYNERMLAEQRAYNEAQAARQAQMDYNAQATATESAEGSTLNFGLLQTGGATEFVDKDKASQVYFGKGYDELTPEQQMLLNLLKRE